MVNRVHFYLENIIVERWIQILISEFQKTHKVSIEIIENCKNNNSFKSAIVEFLFSIEQKISGLLKTNIFDLVSLDSSLLKEKSDNGLDLAFNLTSQKINNCIEINFGTKRFCKYTFNESLFIKKGHAINIQTFSTQKSKVLQNYKTSNSASFISGRRMNLVAALSDLILYTDINSSKNIEKETSNFQYTSIFEFLLNYPISLVSSKLNSKFSNKTWHIGVCKGSQPLQILKMPKGEFWADPFLAKNGNRYSLFFERMHANSTKGVISHKYLDEEDSEVQDVIIEDYHLSFPNVYHVNGEVQIIPESKEDGKISLYKFNQYPLNLVKSEVVFPGINAVDSEIFLNQGLYWLFCTVKTSILSNSGEILNIYYSESMQGPWKSHAQNPIKMDNSSSRNAGKIFERNGNLIRPVQNCSLGYGGAVKFMQIVKLNTDHYEEVFLEEILPTQYHKKATALHTVNFLEDYIVIDMVIDTKYANKV
jgi:hypothetical protein